MAGYLYLWSIKTYFIFNIMIKEVLIFIAIVLIAYFFTRFIKFKSGKKPRFTTFSLILGCAMIFVLSFLTVIPAQEVGVVITPAGVQQHTRPTGWHIIAPWNTVQKMDKTIQVYTCAETKYVDRNSADYKSYKADATQSGTVWAPTRDGIKMGFDISASWQIDPEYAWWIYDKVAGEDNSAAGRFYWIEENVIKAKLKSSLALIVSKYDPIGVYSTERQNIQNEVFEKMREDISSYHLILNQIDIREVYFNPDYEQAINAKKLEEQRVLALVEITKQKREEQIQAEINKNIAILKAQGEAEALQIKGRSISSNPRIIELEWINKWDGKLPTYMLGQGNGVMLNLDKIK